ncbi:hypothetical protein Poly21_46550 [Allorhodopirellula heiligendammensis]|uniref:Uncharacterized protein n=1 Tax=Allorhodopirellula heiligendammensis TaxID=2714739 RepID=A0A5C6BHP2_9BACT|nr:hypothetical protein Poly21_46550 [Allorhodopirellula heiligendammensis]
MSPSDIDRAAGSTSRADEGSVRSVIAAATPRCCGTMFPSVAAELASAFRNLRMKIVRAKFLASQLLPHTSPGKPFLCIIKFAFHLKPDGRVSPH